YWDRNPDLWGDVQNWNVFYINKVPDNTLQGSHSALSSELDILLKNMRMQILFIKVLRFSAVIWMGRRVS
ncbi:17715_t:CDS:2, partial [Entrophospora sp. SA101]